MGLGIGWDNAKSVREEICTIVLQIAMCLIEQPNRRACARHLLLYCYDVAFHHRHEQAAFHFIQLVASFYLGVLTCDINPDKANYFGFVLFSFVSLLFFETRPLSSSNGSTIQPMGLS
jgi:hypothetical protein